MIAIETGRSYYNATATVLTYIASPSRCYHLFFADITTVKLIINAYR